MSASAQEFSQCRVIVAATADSRGRYRLLRRERKWTINTYDEIEEENEDRMTENEAMESGKDKASSHKSTEQKKQGKGKVR